jgi:hypothetical protein
MTPANTDEDTSGGHTSGGDPSGDDTAGDDAGDGTGSPTERQPGVEPVGVQPGFEPVGVQPGFEPVVVQPGVEPVVVEHGFWPIVALVAVLAGALLDLPAPVSCTPRFVLDASSVISPLSSGSSADGGHNVLVY